MEKFNLKTTYDVYTWSTEEEIGKYGNNPFMFKKNVSKEEALNAEDEVLSCSDCTNVKTVKHGAGFYSRKINVWPRY